MWPRPEGETIETIIRNVKDLNGSERTAAEQIVGHELAENQQLVIVINNGEQLEPSEKAHELSNQLPDWCNVYEGLDECEIESLEKVILTRADLARPARK